VHGPRFLLEHSFTRRRLSAYVDRDLDPRERDRVERHIDECRECAGVARSLERLLACLAFLGRHSRCRLAPGMCETLRIRLLHPGEAGKR